MLCGGFAGYGMITCGTLRADRVHSFMISFSGARVERARLVLTQVLRKP